MKALTICQPYAELIMLGEKHIENRKWETRYRGPLLIHAGKSTAWLDSYSPLPDKMDFGAIVGVVELIYCCHVRVIRDQHAGGRWKHLIHDPHTSGPFCWILGNPKRFAVPIPYRGQQTLFDIPDDVVQEALANGRHG